MQSKQSEPSVSYQLSLYTYTHREEAWFGSFAENLPLIREGRNIMDMPYYQEEPAFIIGAGPSMERFQLLDKLKGVAGRVFCADRMLKPCLERGIEPDVCVTVDGDPSVADFYPEGHVGRTSIVLGVQTHPDVVRKIKDPPYWFIPWYDDPLAPRVSLTRALHWMTRKKAILPPFGNSGAFATAMAVRSKCSPIILLGIDFSYGDEVNPAKTLYWKGFVEEYKRVGKGIKSVIDECYRHYRTGHGHRVLTDLVMDGYKGAMMEGIIKINFKVWNVSPFSIVGSMLRQKKDRLGNVVKGKNGQPIIEEYLDPHVEYVDLEEAIRKARTSSGDIPARP